MYARATTDQFYLHSLGKGGIDVTADYLTALCSHAYALIESRGFKEYLEQCNTQFVLTVPAIWSEHGKDFSLRVRSQ